MDTGLISALIGISVGLGTLIAGIGFAYAQFKSGGDKYKDNLIDTLKESVAILEEKTRKQSEEKSLLVTSHQTQLTELSKSLGVLKGRFDEQTRQIEMYKQLLQGRDPEQTKVLQEVHDLLTKINKNSKTLKGSK